MAHRSVIVIDQSTSIDDLCSFRFPLLVRFPMYTGDKSEGPSRSTDNFTAILEAAKKEYKKLTRKDLDTHRFSVQLKNCTSPEAFSDVLQEQAHTFSKSSESDERLMHSLRPIVQILSTFSETIVQGVGIVSHLIRPE